MKNTNKNNKNNKNNNTNTNNTNHTNHTNHTNGVFAPLFNFQGAEDRILRAAKGDNVPRSVFGEYAVICGREAVYFTPTNDGVFAIRLETGEVVKTIPRLYTEDNTLRVFADVLEERVRKASIREGIYDAFELEVLRVTQGMRDPHDNAVVITAFASRHGVDVGFSPPMPLQVERGESPALDKMLRGLGLFAQLEKADGWHNSASNLFERDGVEELWDLLDSITNEGVISSWMAVKGDDGYHEEDGYWCEPTSDILLVRAWGRTYQISSTWRSFDTFDLRNLRVRPWDWKEVK